MAELAGTSLRAVRHYHEVGLLAEPERKGNGYKSYGVGHLVRLLRIRRLIELGFSLAQIGEMAAGEVRPTQALRELDAELAAKIQRLQRVRDELALLMRRPTPTDLPAELAAAAAGADIPEADRAFLVVLTRVLGPTTLHAYADAMAAYYASPAAAEFERLPEDADERTRDELAERLVPAFRTLLARYPQLQAPAPDAPRGVFFAGRIITDAINDLYHPAQIDVLRRMGKILAFDFQHL
ncbi:DNA-binding transcriptional MerR regulator [Nocardia tenerifensis]|uniref:DNA-binding transcriptional MerR regulator n=1 Tax=Nocardia tenerifensis TaxID=228006 RepID=A0A318KAQ8_9NOCA|nr:DNA-binding transcriptional MerR regulator [Nocardia tenerifensis]